jgi:diaminohydroxyphosphoribosylaminopyrimidine deaminase/5-amino-6-(5-phosphoribosylamino)uracil reductase
MRQAVRLALRARGRTSPNPLVGCVIVQGERVLATGWHKRAGEDHAEAAALRKLDWRAPRATAYVTLEPHGFQGRTPPCTDRLIAAKVARVVVGMKDPNPRVAGAGLKQLARAGIEVEAGVLAEACRAINRPYLTYVASSRPWVTLKAAVTLDGRLAARGGDAKWVSGELSRLEAHRMRDVSDAILVGANTVRLDDPALTTRLPSGRGHDPKRVILDGRLTVPPDAKCLPGAIVMCAHDADAARARRLEKRGAEIVRLPGKHGRIEPKAVVKELGQREILSLLVEGGGQVHGAFLAAGLADEVALFVAPKLIGAGGVPLIGVDGPTKMAAAWRLGAVSTRRLGDDILVVGDVLRNA